MDLFEAVKTRRSIRRYRADDVSDEMIENMITAAMAAPSAGNQQPWQFLIVRDRKKLEAVQAFHPYCKMAASAPAAVVVCGDPDGKKWPDFWVQDCSAAIQNFLLAARAMGVGSVWTGVYPVAERVDGCRKLFSIPQRIIPLAIIPVGYPVDDTEFRNINRYNPALVHKEVFQE